MREPPGIEGSEAKRGDRLGAGPQRVHLFDLEQLPAESLDCDEAPPSDAGADAGVESRATQQSRQDLCHLKSRSSASEVREGPPESRASWPADAQMHATGAEPRGQEASQEPQQQKHSTGAPASPPLAGRVGAAAGAGAGATTGVAAGKKSKQAVGSSKRPKRSGFMSPHGVGVGVGEGVEGWEAREGPLFRSYAQAPPVMVGRSLGPEMKEAIMRLDREMQQQEQAGWEQKRHMAAAAAAGDAPLRLSGRYGGNGAQAAQGGLPSTVPQTSGMQSSDRTWASSEGAKGMVTAGVKQDQLVPSDGRAHPHAHRYGHEHGHGQIGTEQVARMRGGSSSIGGPGCGGGGGGGAGGRGGTYAKHIGIGECGEHMHTHTHSHMWSSGEALEGAPPQRQQHQQQQQQQRHLAAYYHPAQSYGRDSGKPFSSWQEAAAQSTPGATMSEQAQHYSLEQPHGGAAAAMVAGPAGSSGGGADSLHMGVSVGRPCLPGSVSGLGGAYTSAHAPASSIPPAWHHHPQLAAYQASYHHQQQQQQQQQQHYAGALWGGGGRSSQLGQQERAMWQWAHALRSTQGGGAHFPPPAHLVEFGAAAHVAIPPAARAPFKRPPPLVLMQDGTTREKTQEEQEQQQRAAQSGSSSSNDDQARATSARSAAPGGGGGKLKGRGRGAAAASRAAAAAGAAPRGAAAGSVGGGGRGQRTGGGAKAATGKGQLGGAAAAAGSEGGERRPRGQRLDNTTQRKHHQHQQQQQQEQQEQVQQRQPLPPPPLPPPEQQQQLAAGLGDDVRDAPELRDGEPRAAPPGGGPGGEDNEDASSACSGEGVVNPPFECVEAVPGGPHGEVALHQHPAARGGAAEGQVAGGKCATSKLAEERVKHASERADGLTRSSSRTKSPGAAQRGKQGAPCGGPSRPRQTLPQDARARGGGVGVCEGALALREVPGVFAGQQVALTGAHGEELRQKSIQAVMGPSELSDDSEEVQGRQVAAPAASSSPSNLGLGAATLGFRSHAAGGPPGGADEDVHVAAAEEPAEDKAASRARQVSAVFAAAADGAADKNASRAPCQVPAASGAGAACARLPLLQASTRGEAEMGEDLKLQSKADPSEGGEGGGGGGGGQVGEDVLPGGKHVQLLRLPGVKSMSPLRGAAEGSLKYRLLKRTSTCPRVPAGDNDMQQLPALVFHAAHKAMSAPAMNSPASLIQSLSLMSPGGGPKEINAGACRAYARVSKVSPEVSNVDAEASTEGGGEGGGGGGGGADVAASRARCDTGKAAATSARQLDDFEMQTLELQRLLR